MANSLIRPVLKIDTSVETNLFPLYVCKMIYRPAAAGNTVAVSDGNDVEHWAKTALAAWPAGEEEIDFGEDGRKIENLKVSITGGSILIYLHN